MMPKGFKHSQKTIDKMRKVKIGKINTAHSLNKHWNWRGGIYKNKAGYVLITIPSEPHKPQFEHRIVLEEKLGRKLNKNERTHHINEIRDDNRPENLISVTIKSHMVIHNSLKFKGIWSKYGHKECKLCKDKKLGSHAAFGLCHKCYWRQKYGRKN